MRQRIIFLALVALTGTSVAAAQEQPSTFEISGYGTLALTGLSSDRADFPGAFGDVRLGVGRSGSSSLSPDSRLAVQLDWKPVDGLSAVAQVMTRRNRFGDYSPSVEMLNLKYDFNADTWIRAGRIAHPFFLASDTRQIGYANLFVRGPVEVYNASAISSSDAVQAGHRLNFADGSLLQISIGAGRARYGTPTSDPRLGRDDAGEFKDLRFVNAVYERGFLQLRYGYTGGTNDYRVNGLSGLEQAAAFDNPSLARELSFRDQKVSFTGLGVVYDPGTWVVQGEYTMTSWDRGKRSLVADTQSAYLLGGVRVGLWTPFLQYAKRMADSPNVVNGFRTPALNAAYTGVAAGTAGEQHSWSAGLRWDLRSNLAAKLQVDRMTLDNGLSDGTLTNANPLRLPREGDDFLTWALALDFMF